MQASFLLSQLSLKTSQKLPTQIKMLHIYMGVFQHYGVYQNISLVIVYSKSRWIKWIEFVNMYLDIQINNLELAYILCFKCISVSANKSTWIISSIIFSASFPFEPSDRFRVRPCNLIPKTVINVGLCCLNLKTLYKFLRSKQMHFRR